MPGSHPSEGAPGPPTPAEAQALRRIAAFRGLAWVGFLAGLPVLVLCGILAPGAIFVVLAGWMVLVAILGGILKWSSCPRCHRFFFIPVCGNKFRSATALIARDCANCGLAL
jgi:hypothetical protein